MGKFINRVTHIRKNKEMPIMKREDIYTPYQVQQPKDKLMLESILHRIPDLSDYKGDVSDLGSILDHLEDKGIPCAHIKKYIMNTQRNVQQIPIFFKSSSQNGNTYDR